MATQLKQRLIGAIVIFGLLIIFLPMIFENHEEQKAVEHLLDAPISKNEIISEKSGSSAVFSNDEKIVTNTNALDNDSSAFLEQSDDTNGVSNMANTISKKTENQGGALDQDKKTSSEQDKNIKTTSEISRVIKYSIDKNATIANNNIYAIKITTVRKKNVAEQVKNLLMAKGFPAYINYNEKRNRYSVYTGPDLELKYIQELANRILSETDYQPEVVAHNKDWLTE